MTTSIFIGHNLKNLNDQTKNKRHKEKLYLTGNVRALIEPTSQGKRGKQTLVISVVFISTRTIRVRFVAAAAAAMMTLGWQKGVTSRVEFVSVAKPSV